MDEFLSEREQAEQLRVWFKENWIWLVAGIALGLGGLYGYRWWQDRQLQRSVAAEQRYTALLDALTRNEQEEGLRLAGELTGEYADTPYADQATLVLARMDVESGELARAATRLAEVMNRSRDRELALVARLRLARVQLAQGLYDQALATLDAAGAPAVAARLQELRGDVLHARGEHPAALESYRQALAAADAGGLAEGLVDRELLELKIDELSASQAVK